MNSLSIADDPNRNLDHLQYDMNLMEYMKKVTPISIKTRNEVSHKNNAWWRGG